MPKRKAIHIRASFPKRQKMNVIPQPPSQQTATGSHFNAQANAGHQETQIDPIASGWQLAPGPPDYTHAVLPFIYERTFSYSAEGASNVIDFGFRMTSVYDPVVDPATGVDINPGSGAQTHRPIKTDDVDTLTDTASGCAFISYYSSLYKYYSVLGCRYKIRIENLSHDKFFVHKMFINNDRPTPYASNWDMKMWRGVDSRLITPMMRFADSAQIWHKENVGYNFEHDDDNMNGSGTTNGTEAGTLAPLKNSIGSSMTYFVGEYRPGQYKREVKLDDDVEIWTPTNQNPKLPEILFLRARVYDNATPENAGDAYNYNRALSFNITVECEYLVEFKELKDEFYRPASRNPILALANTLQQDGLD